MDLLSTEAVPNNLPVVLSSFVGRARELTELGRLLEEERLVTLSGAGAAWGQALLYGAELAADDVNAQGGLEVGGKKYKTYRIYERAV